MADSPLTRAVCRAVSLADELCQFAWPVAKGSDCADALSKKLEKLGWAIKKTKSLPRQANEFRGLYPDVPEAIVGIDAASYHEMGRSFAKKVHQGVARAILTKLNDDLIDRNDYEGVGWPVDELNWLPDPGEVRSAWAQVLACLQQIARRAGHTICGRLIVRIQDEAARRAARDALKSREGPSSLATSPAATPNKGEGKGGAGSGRPVQKGESIANLSLLERYSATPAGHVAFLEFVRDEVHNAAEAKRQQLVQGYSKDTLASMVRGIKWSEAGERIAVLRDLAPDAAEQVAVVLRRELTVGTVEQLDELFSPAVQSLRDALENSRNSSTSPTAAKPDSAAADHAPNRHYIPESVVADCLRAGLHIPTCEIPGIVVKCPEEWTWFAREWNRQVAERLDREWRKSKGFDPEAVRLQEASMGLTDPVRLKAYCEAWIQRLRDDDEIAPVAAVDAFRKAKSALKSSGRPCPDVPPSLLRFDEGPLWLALLRKDEKDKRPLNVPANLLADLLQAFKQIIGTCDPAAAPGEPPAATANDALDDADGNKKWCHEPTEQRPEAYKYGPITGQKKEICIWMGEKPSRNMRRLNQKANKTVWVIRQAERSWEVWFKDERTFQLADNNRRFALKSS